MKKIEKINAHILLDYMQMCWSKLEKFIIWGWVNNLQYHSTYVPLIKAVSLDI